MANNEANGVLGSKGQSWVDYFNKLRLIDKLVSLHNLYQETTDNETKRILTQKMIDFGQAFVAENTMKLAQLNREVVAKAKAKAIVMEKRR